MRTNQTTIVPLDLPSITPIQVARVCYLKWQSTPFYEDLEDYLERGIVISRPDIFAMAKIIEAGEGQALFVRMAVGKLRTLLSALPVLPAAICFCRRNETRLRVYSLAKLLQVTDKLIKRKTDVPETL
jgi:hypothetical protein